jgi:hypothetical protein
MTHEHFATTTRGLDRNVPAMRLYEKAKRHGIWNPMNDILVPAISIIGEGLAPYDPVPFGLVEQDFVDYALKQFKTRIGRIESARGRSLEQIYRVTHSVIEQDDEDG